jgi:hypothetical protein
MLFRLLHCLGNGSRNLCGLAFSDADPPLPITDYDQCAKIESLATFDDLGDTIDKDHLIFQIEFFRIYSHAIMLLLACSAWP